MRYIIGLALATGIFALGASATETQDELKADITAVKAAVDTSSGPPVVEPMFRSMRGYSEYGDPGPYWPERAERLGVSGAAALRCSITQKGMLTNCTVMAEAPRDFGFGRAALLMAREGYLIAKLAADAQDADQGRLLVRFVNQHVHQ